MPTRVGQGLGVSVLVCVCQGLGVSLPSWALVLVSVGQGPDVSLWLVESYFTSCRHQLASYVVI